jgi:hypothetical protein
LDDAVLLLAAVHRVGLAARGLAVREDGRVEARDRGLDQRADGVAIDRPGDGLEDAVEDGPHLVFSFGP